MSEAREPRSRPTVRAAFLLLALHATGVVYGDIGTSVLYAINEIFYGHGGASREPANIMGAISLALWALTLVITVKYVWCVLYADHRGEGGVFALLAKVTSRDGAKLGFLGLLLILSAGLLYGDGVITPAISVLSAIEGLKVITPAFEPYVVPLTVVILCGLFALQRFGTAGVGSVFGPAIVLWFVSIGAIGLSNALGSPEIFWALNPWHGAQFLLHNNLHTNLAVLGSVILVITGGEALYADMGHFGRRPIQASWMAIVYPCLMLNYLGQGAFLLSGQQVRSNNVFFSMVPQMVLVPMVVLATLAAVIASQAMITGAYSITAQATALGLLPRYRTKHTSAHHEGQIYLPAVNTGLLVGCLTLVVLFRSSTNLAAAYGLAVAGVMFTTSLVMMVIARDEWRWPAWRAYAFFGVFATIDFAFVTANLAKFAHGGYVPVIIGLALFFVMTTWRRGRLALGAAYRAFTTKTIAWLVERKAKSAEAEHLHDSGLADVATALQGERVMRILPRGSVFLASRPVETPQDYLPAPIRAFLKRYGAIAEEVVIFHVRQLSGIPNVPHADRHEVIDFGEGIVSVIASYGFRDEINIHNDLRELQRQDKIMRTDRLWTVEVGQEEIRIDPGYSDLPRFINNVILRGTTKLIIRVLGLLGVRNIAWAAHIRPLKGMPLWQRARYKLFRVLLRSSVPVNQYFGLALDMNISTVLIPVIVTVDGVQIFIPDLETPQRDDDPATQALHARVQGGDDSVRWN